MTPTDTSTFEQGDGPEAALKSLPLSQLISAPLVAALDAQVQLAKATEDFIKTIGFAPSTVPGGAAEPRMASFAFSRPAMDESDPSLTRQEEVRMEVPMLAIVKIPSLHIDTMDLAFEVAVTGWGSVAGGGEPPTAEGVLTGPHSALGPPGYTITMKAVSAPPTDAMARVMDELTKGIAPVIQSR